VVFWAVEQFASNFLTQKEVNLTGDIHSASMHRKYGANGLRLFVVATPPSTTSLPYSLHCDRPTTYGSLRTTARRVSYLRELLKWRRSENLTVLYGTLRQKHRLSKRDSRIGIGGLGLMSDIYQNALVRIL